MANIKHAMVSSLVLWACAGPGTDGTNVGERVTVQSSELNEACANVTTPVATGINKIDYTSPITYSQAGCYKGQVVQLNMGLGGAPSVPNGAVVTWASAVPTTESACTSAWLGVYWFEKDSGTGAGSGGIGGGVGAGGSSSSTYRTREIQTKTGTWSSGVCTTPQIPFPFGLLPGVVATFRFAISARTAPTTNAPTRSFKIVTQ